MILAHHGGEAALLAAAAGAGTPLLALALRAQMTSFLRRFRRR